MRSQLANGLVAAPPSLIVVPTFDANTVAEWQLHDPIGAASIAETNGTYPLTPTAGAPRLRKPGVFQASAQFYANAAFRGGNTCEPTGNAITVEGWFQTTGVAAAAQYLVCKGFGAGWPYNDGADHYESVAIFLEQNNTWVRAAWDLGAGEVLGAQVAFTIGTGWHHVGHTYDGANARLYLDGALVDTTASVGSISYGTHQAWALGNNHVVGTDRYFNGKLEQWRVHNVVRDATWFAGVRA